MSNCSNHKKELFGQTDMKHLAEDIGSLHYGSLYLLLYHLYKKLDEDSIKDYKANREKLAAALQYASMSIFESALRMQKVWQICEPFMPNPEQNPERNKK
jgi:hypothetical protein